MSKDSHHSVTTIHKIELEKTTPTSPSSTAVLNLISTGEKSVSSHSSSDCESYLSKNENFSEKLLPANDPGNKLLMVQTTLARIRRNSWYKGSKIASSVVSNYQLCIQQMACLPFDPGSNLVGACEELRRQWELM